MLEKLSLRRVDPILQIKMSISLKEANETDYWLDLLHATDFLNEDEFEKFKPKSQEMLRLLVSIVKSSKD